MILAEQRGGVNTRICNLYTLYTQKCLKSMILFMAWSVVLVSHLIEPRPTCPDQIPEKRTFCRSFWFSNVMFLGFRVIVKVLKENCNENCLIVILWTHQTHLLFKELVKTGIVRADEVKRIGPEENVGRNGKFTHRCHD